MNFDKVDSTSGKCTRFLRMKIKCDRNRCINISTSIYNSIAVFFVFGSLVFGSGSGLILLLQAWLFVLGWLELIKYNIFQYESGFYLRNNIFFPFFVFLNIF